MQKFFTNTLESKFIKELLYKKPLYLIKTIKNNEIAYKDIIYLYEGKIIKIISTGTINTDCKYKVLGYFNDISPDKKLISYFMSEYSFYDSETHEILGNYLRQYRDITGIDLLPFYNCFSYNVDLNISITEKNQIQENKIDGFNSILIPIRTNKTYNIAIDCPYEIKITPVLYSKYGILKNNDIIGTDYILTIQGIKFKDPFIFKFNLSLLNDEQCAKIINNEKYLKLLIQIPKNNNSSIVVIEGDIKQNKFLSDLSLLLINNKTIYAFSDRLIEYLLLNVVTGEDHFYYNIEYILEKLKLNLTKENMALGTWSNSIKEILYNRYMNLNLMQYPKIDINGYLDKDIERALQEEKLSNE